MKKISLLFLLAFITNVFCSLNAMELYSQEKESPKLDFITWCGKNGPEEMVMEIFGNLGPNELNLCSQVATEWRRLAIDDVLWRKRVEELFAALEDKLLQKRLELLIQYKPEGEAWRNFYLRVIQDSDFACIKKNFFQKFCCPKIKWKVVDNLDAEAREQERQLARNVNIDIIIKQVCSGLVKKLIARQNIVVKDLKPEEKKVLWQQLSQQFIDQQLMISIIRKYYEELPPGMKWLGRFAPSIWLYEISRTKRKNF